MGIAPCRATYAGARGDEDVGIARKTTPPAPGLHEDVGIAPSRATYAGPRRDEDVGIARPRFPAPARTGQILETLKKSRPASTTPQRKERPQIRLGLVHTYIESSQVALNLISKLGSAPR